MSDDIDGEDVPAGALAGFVAVPMVSITTVVVVAVTGAWFPILVAVWAVALILYMVGRPLSR